MMFAPRLVSFETLGDRENASRPLPALLFGTTITSMILVSPLFPPTLTGSLILRKRDQRRRTDPMEQTQPSPPPPPPAPCSAYARSIPSISNTARPVGRGRDW